MQPHQLNLPDFEPNGQKPEPPSRLRCGGADEQRPEGRSNAAGTVEKAAKRLGCSKITVIRGLQKYRATQEIEQ